MNVAIVGGTGGFGRALARRLRAAGYAPVVGSRDAERARAAASALGLDGATNRDAVRAAELVVLAIPADAVVETARDLAASIGDTPTLCVASGLRAQTPSLAEQVAAVVAAPVAAGMHTVSAQTFDREQDALVCGDDERAKQLALDLAGRVVTGRALDAGPLSNSTALEALTGVLLALNKRYGGHAGIRITGL